MRGLLLRWTTQVQSEATTYNQKRKGQKRKGQKRKGKKERAKKKGQKRKGLLLGNKSPRKTHSVSRSFFDRGVGSSILASLSEAGGNDQHSSLSKPLPPRSQTCESRFLKCVHDSLLLHAVGQSC